jgi:hypothetical protein
LPILHDAGLPIVRLLAAIFAFTAIGYIGTKDKRLTGLLLTFPLLNGIALIGNPEPFIVANTIYAVVVFNALLFAGIISFGHRLVSHGGTRNLSVGFLVLAWTLVWSLGASLLTIRPAAITGPFLFAGASVLCVAFTLLAWTRPLASDVGHASGSSFKGYVGFWCANDKFLRILIFVCAFLVLLVVSANFSAAWVGTFSALPLPGLFALASLTVDSQDTRPIRDTVLWGPILVIPFNFLLATAITALATIDRYNGLTSIVLLVVFWLVALAISFGSVLWLSPILDSKSGRASEAVE